ncbi:MAG TPA: C39 family peptidase [Anaerolineales bacterium]
MIILVLTIKQQVSAENKLVTPLNTAPPKWLEPPKPFILAAINLAGLLTAFTLVFYFILPKIYSGGPPGFPLPFPFPFPLNTSTLQPSPTATFTPIPSSTPTVTLSWTATRTPFQPLPPTNTPTLTPTPTRTPKPTKTRAAPSSAQVDGVAGHPMISSLDCEGRAAADWAAFFGVPIDEREFLDKLPSSDNPEKGFVGRWWDPAGSIPPNSYGVHAGPVAKLLRAYGLKARAYKGASLRDLKEEIAAGHPVIVWVIGSVQAVKNGVKYTASDGETTVVAPYEHTVMLIGYDEQQVTILDTAYVYTRSIRDFEISWGVLGNMAVMYRK